MLERIRYIFSKESCYDMQLKTGNAKDGKCGGVVCGTKATEYLSESCADCKYFSFGRGVKMTELHFGNAEGCIERIKSIKEMYAKDTPSEVALSDAIKALEKQIPKKPIKDQFSHECCPCCGWIVYKDEYGGRYLPHCENCGQAIDWSDTD